MPCNSSFTWITSVYQHEKSQTNIEWRKHKLLKDVHKYNLCKLINLSHLCSNSSLGSLPLAMGTCLHPSQVLFFALLTRWHHVLQDSIFLDSVYIVFVICMYDKSKKKKEYMEKIYSNFRRVVILGGRERKGGWGVLWLYLGCFISLKRFLTQMLQNINISFVSMVHITKVRSIIFSVF